MHCCPKRLICIKTNFLLCNRLKYRLPQLVFLRKHVWELWASKWFPCPTSDVFGQHWLDNIPMQCCLSMVGTVLYGLFSYWKLSVRHEPAIHWKFPRAMLAQTDSDKFLDYFSVQICLWTVGQYCTGNIRVQYWPSQIKATFIGYFTAERWLCALSQHCTSFLRCLVFLDNIG